MANFFSQSTHFWIENVSDSLKRYQFWFIILVLLRKDKCTRYVPKFYLNFYAVRNFPIIVPNLSFLNVSWPSQYDNNHIVYVRNKTQIDQESTAQHHKANKYLNQDLNLGLLRITLVLCLYQHIRDFLIKAKPIYKHAATSGLKNVFIFREMLLSSICQRLVMEKTKP